MHDQARQWFIDTCSGFRPGAVLEIGGLNVNGGVKDVVPHVSWLSTDITAGPGVDLVTDAATMTLGRVFDHVICAEVLEHTPVAAEIVANAFAHLGPGGTFVASMAGPGRAPHGQHGAGSPTGGEWYQNVTVDELTGWLTGAGFDVYEVDVLGLDLRCWARRP